MRTDGDLDVWSGDTEATVNYGQPPVLPVEEDTKQNSNQ